MKQDESGNQGREGHPARTAGGRRSVLYLLVQPAEGYVPVRNSAYETKMFQEYVELGENYGKCASVVTEKINGAYLVSDAFKGSANLRTVCGSLLTAAVKANKSEIPGLIQQAIDDALLKM